MVSKKVAHFVGLDYHQDEIQVCILDRQGVMLANKKLPNDTAILDHFVRRHCAHFQASIEACTGAAAIGDELRHLYHWDIRQAHAGYVSRMKRSPDKTDYSDARILADLVRVDYLPEVWLPPVHICHLRSMVRRRDQLIKDRTREKLRLRALLRNYRLVPPGSAWSRSWIAWLTDSDKIPEDIAFVLEDLLDSIKRLTERVDKVMERLVSMTKDDPLVNLLLGQAGIGIVTAVAMRSEIGDFGRFRTGKQLSNFCGVSPRNASSGNRQATSGLILAGSPLLRCVLIEAAHRLTRYDDHWRGLFQRLHGKKHKPKCVALAAVANRWIRRIFHQVMESLSPSQLAA
jgi:transposase